MDPAVESVAEVVFCYPGYFATFVQRTSHILFTKVGGVC